MEIRVVFAVLRGSGRMGETKMPGGKGLCDTGKKTRLLCEAESEIGEREL
jgi:hypothetical protein